MVVNMAEQELHLSLGRLTLCLYNSQYQSYRRFGGILLPICCGNCAWNMPFCFDNIKEIVVFLIEPVIGF